MGLMRLAVHDKDRIPPTGLERIYICGSDELHGELPWFARAFFSGEQLVIERKEDDSGWIFVPWRVDGHGEVMLATTTLMERPRPYRLEVELARGTVNQLRNHFFQWQFFGLEIPAEVRDEMLTATRLFSKAATSRDDPALAARFANEAMTVALETMNKLADVYATQAINLRRAQSNRLGTLLGIQLGDTMPQLAVARQLPQAFNLAAVGLSWLAIESREGKRRWEQVDAQIQWAQQAGIKVCAGPLLQFADTGIPDWAYLWEGDFPSIRDFMLNHVRRVIQRYQGKVHLWNIASRTCCGRALGLSEEQRLQISAQAVAAAREIDPRTPMVISFDQPWGEYLASERLDYAPLHFADALVRADLGLSGLGLELNIGYHPRGSSRRAPLAYNRLIDCWSMLELPLMVTLTVPSSMAPDPKADPKVGILGTKEDNITPESQQEWANRYLPLLLAKPTVQVVFWNQLTDAQPHEFPHGGLFDEQDNAKPLLQSLSTIRGEYLM